MNNFLPETNRKLVSNLQLLTASVCRRLHRNYNKRSSCGLASVTTSELQGPRDVGTLELWVNDSEEAGTFLALPDLSRNLDG